MITSKASLPKMKGAFSCQMIFFSKAPTRVVGLILSLRK